MKLAQRLLTLLLVAVLAFFSAGMLPAAAEIWLYTLYVTDDAISNGTSFQAGTRVSVSVFNLPTDQQLLRWEISPQVELVNRSTINCELIFFDMPAQSVTVTPVFGSVNIAENNAIWSITSNFSTLHESIWALLHVDEVNELLLPGKTFQSSVNAFLTLEDKHFHLAITAQNPGWIHGGTVLAYRNGTLISETAAAFIAFEDFGLEHFGLDAQALIERAASIQEDPGGGMFGTGREPTLINILLFFVGFGWIWMWLF